MITVQAYRQLPRLLGAQAFVILGLLHAAQLEGIGPVKEQWLFDNSPAIGKNMITAALRKLTSPEYQLAVRVQGGWVFNSAGAFQLPLGYALVDDQQPQMENPAQREIPSQRDFSTGQVIDAVPVVDEKEQKTAGITAKNPAQREIPSQRDFSGSLVKTDSILKDSKDSLNCLDSQTAQESENRILLENAYRLIGKPILWRKEFADKSRAEILAWLAQVCDAGARAKRPWGIVYHGLLGDRDQKEPDIQYRTDPLKYLSREYLKACGLIPAEQPPAELDPDPGEEDSPEDDQPEPFLAIPVDDPRIVKAWETVLSMLQMEMPRASFDAWVRATVPVAWDDQHGDMSIQTRNAYSADWLENRLTSTVERLLTGILNRSVTVHFSFNFEQPGAAGDSDD